MRKKLLILLLVLFCFGCKANYDLVINDDLSVEETIVGLENEQFYDKYYRSTKERVIGIVTYLVDDYLNKNNYSRKIISKFDYTGEKVATKFNSLDEYYEKSEAYKQLYNNWEIKKEGKIITINLKDKLPKNGNSIDRYIIHDCTVTVELPFLVKEHNADSYNKETNVYTWNLKIDEDKDIFIKFDTSKKIDSFNLISIICIGIVIFIILIILAFLSSRKKNANKI